MARHRRRFDFRSKMNVPLRPTQCLQKSWRFLYPWPHRQGNAPHVSDRRSWRRPGRSLGMSPPGIRQQPLHGNRRHHGRASPGRARRCQLESTSTCRAHPDALAPPRADVDILDHHDDCIRQGVHRKAAPPCRRTARGPDTAWDGGGSCPPHQRSYGTMAAEAARTAEGLAPNGR